MRSLCRFLLCLFLAQTAGAVCDDVTHPDVNLQAKMRIEADAPSAEARRIREEAGRAAAEARAEKIRNLPAELVPAWIEGRISEEELNRLPSVAPTEVQAAASSVVVEVPRRRLFRLGFAFLLVLVLGGAVGFRRLREMGLMPPR